MVEDWLESYMVVVMGSMERLSMETPGVISNEESPGAEAGV
jgi:hypothetical protein